MDRRRDTGLVSKTRQFTLALAYWLRPPRTASLPFLLAGTIKDRLIAPPAIPDDTRIRRRPAGFAGLAPDLTTDTVLTAMDRGFYPQAHWGEMKWWSPPNRAVMPLHAVHMAKRFRRTMRNSDMRVSMDTAFATVMERCAEPRSNRQIHLTWITPDAMELYGRLHWEGHAHSVEVFSAEGELVGGLFGLASGPFFSALSMFHTEDNASKFAIASLYHHLAEAGFLAVDHQIMSPWVEALGGITLERDAYTLLLERPGAVELPVGKWAAKFTLADTAAWQPANSETAASGSLPENPADLRCSG
ncbi:leucyl/phenylalanyl-tRNA--protein transferase [Pelagibacterium montanilacus]|uniref:leucyl/phenylalanyl-tRNA--protein transferase n=1 Tax=Pelagibacterium montanilacus TaxID=2185280 RepID=UPI0013DEEB00|nr:leucyl/phenylalanyl-tRNA--protein transferase [Pelagibacterium montanilacus]